MAATSRRCRPRPCWMWPPTSGSSTRRTRGPPSGARRTAWQARRRTAWFCCVRERRRARAQVDWQRRGGRAGRVGVRAAQGALPGRQWRGGRPWRARVRGAAARGWRARAAGRGNQGLRVQGAVPLRPCSACDWQCTHAEHLTAAARAGPAQIALQGVDNASVRARPTSLTALLATLARGSSARACGPGDGPMSAAAARSSASTTCACRARIYWTASRAWTRRAVSQPLLGVAALCCHARRADRRARRAHLLLARRAQGAPALPMQCCAAAPRAPGDARARRRAGRGDDRGALQRGAAAVWAAGRAGDQRAGLYQPAGEADAHAGDCVRAALCHALPGRAVRGGQAHQGGGDCGRRARAVRGCGRHN